ncbi:hypothetical protein D9758_003913 [Tetrapyrgos nigripes]|uniref:RING-type domain-containing protein n=1 Tax=Tetrapyrgos nigripes TaxID=182062 RepID=A0A8H5GL92_9AGAR|nr:hypothetical protein D9758_003913 [Tetrapyrgos nigripes]
MLVVHAASCCDVCLEQYVWEETEDSGIRAPHAIACGHVFCKTCLESIEPAHCPLCRRGYRRDHIKKLHAEPPDVMDEDIENGFLQKVLMTWDDEVGIVDVIQQVDEWLANKRSDFGTSLRRMKMLQDQFAQMKKQCDDDSFKIHSLRAKLKHREDAMVHDNNLHMVHQENLNEHVEILKRRVQENEEEISTLRTQLQTIPRMPEYVPGSPQPPYPYPPPFQPPSQLPSQFPPRKESLPLEVDSVSEDYDTALPRRDKGKGREIIPDVPDSGVLPNTLLSNPLPAPPVDYLSTVETGSSLELQEIQAAIEASRNDQYFWNGYISSAGGPSGTHAYSNGTSASSVTPVANDRPSSVQHPQSSVQYPPNISAQSAIPSTAQYPSSVQYPQTYNPQPLQANGIDNYANSSSKQPSQSLSVAMQEARQQQRHSPPRRVRVVSGAPESQRVVPDVPYVRQADIYRDPLAPIVEETSTSDNGTSSRTKTSGERRRRKKKRESEPIISDQEARAQWARTASEREHIKGVVGLGLIDEDNTPVDPKAYKDEYEKGYKEGFGYAASTRIQQPPSAPVGSTNGAINAISGTGKIQLMNPRRQVPSAAMNPHMIQARQKVQPLPPTFNPQRRRHDDTASMLSGLSTQTWGSYFSNRSTGSELFGQLQMFSRATNDQDNPGSWEVSTNDPHAFLPPMVGYTPGAYGNGPSTMNTTQTAFSGAPSLRRSSTATGNTHSISESRNRPNTSSFSARPSTLSHSTTMPDISTLQLSLSHSGSEDRRRERDPTSAREETREERRARRRASASAAAAAATPTQNLGFGPGAVSQAQPQLQIPHTITTNSYIPSIPSRQYVGSHPDPDTLAPSSSTPSILPSGNALGLNLHSEPETIPSSASFPNIVAPTPIASHEMFLRSFSNDSANSGGGARY